jgi:4-hydroxy-2-oxoheptanedioate aldolase
VIRRGIIRIMSDPFDRSFRDRVLARDTLFGLFLDLGSAASAELCGALGYDWLLVDLEHGSGGEADLADQFRAIAAAGDAAPLVRPQSGERIRIGRALDLGARGVMVPRLESAAQAAEAVTYLRYPPDGIRGVATRVRGAGLGVVSHPEVRRLNERVVGIIQIESVGALREADQIAALDGVDVLFVGPADLSHSLGIPGQFDHADYRTALERVAAACREHGKAAGILIYDPAVVPGLVDLGYSFIGIGADAALVSEGAKRSLAAVRG